MSRHTFEEKLNIVSQVKDGKSIHCIAREGHIREGMIIEWVKKYNLYGESGLKKRSSVKASPDLKEEIVRLVLDKSLPLPHVVLRYGVSQSALEGWVRLVKAKGYSSLYCQKKRGRPSKPMGRPKKREPETELEKLQAENLRLRAENALLKKVKTLVEEQKARARLNGQKPSTD